MKESETKVLVPQTGPGSHALRWAKGYPGSSAGKESVKNAGAAAAAAKSLQSCPTLCDPIDGSPPGSPSLGFSKQEHWSGLPFPSPMHETAK